MEKESRYEGLKASVGMAVVDTIPCVLFAVLAVCLSMAVKQPLFIVGQILCALAGFGKAVWKYIKAIARKNVEWLASQFKFTMSAGFLLCILSLLIGQKRLPLSLIWKNLMGFPVWIMVLAGLLLMCAMIVLGAKMDPSSVKANWTEQIVNLAAQLMFMLASVIIWYASTHYPAAHPYVPNEVSEVRESEVKGGLYFDGPGTRDALVFYPGGLVEYTAYVPLMREIAAGGVDCFLVEMPYHLAVFGMNKADKVLKEYGDKYERWFMGGHSLGGSMASVYASKHGEKIKGILLLGSYSTVNLNVDPDFITCLVYGSEDKVLSREAYEKNKKNVSSEVFEYVIEGGNHGGFGDYGHQKGDGIAAIDGQTQIRKTVEFFLKTIE